jgi:hypothetical protein
MGIINSPNIVRDGLVAVYDAASIRSFQGVARTNLARGVNYNRSNTNTSTYKYTQGTEVVDIPQVGKRTVKYADHWNDYNGGSGDCCPSLFYYHDGWVSVSGSTTYTYSLIYKTTTGYTHPNFMYRYEYVNSSTYVTEGGVHNDSNRIHLGDGWYYAWGQFTTQPSTNTMILYLFYYQYATWDRVYVDRVSLVAGSTVPDVKHITTYNSTNSGNWTDNIGGYTGTLTNGPTYDSNNGGSIVFDGSNDYVSLGNLGTIGNFQTIDVWFYSTSVTNYRNILDMNYGNYANTGNVGPRLEQFSDGTANWLWSGVTNSNSFYQYTNTFSISANTWYNATWVNNNGTIAIYLNGSTIQTGVSSPQGFLTTFGAASIGRGFHLDSSRYFSGRVPLVKIYSTALSATQVQQNFEATRARFGV